MTKIDPMKRTLLKLIGLGALAGCASAKAEGRSVSIDKYNYTGRYIADVTVDGVWAGGADAYSGGGDRIQGLLAPKDPNKQVVLKINWVVGSQYDIATNQYTRRPPEPHETSIELPVPHPSDADLLVLHFYPDGHVEGELTGKRQNRRIPPPPGYHR